MKNISRPLMIISGGLFVFNLGILNHPLWGVMGLPLVISDYRSKKILKRFKVTPLSPAVILFVQVIGSFANERSKGTYLLLPFAAKVKGLFLCYRSDILMDSIATLPPRTTSTFLNWLVRSFIMSLFFFSVRTHSSKMLSVP